MLKEAVVEFYGNQTRTAEALGYKSTGTISQWSEIIPESAAMKLHMLTDGQLKYDPALYDKNTADSVDISCSQLTNPADA